MGRCLRKPLHGCPRIHPPTPPPQPPQQAAMRWCACMPQQHRCSSPRVRGRVHVQLRESVSHVARTVVREAMARGTSVAAAATAAAIAASAPAPSTPFWSLPPGQAAGSLDLAGLGWMWVVRVWRRVTACRAGQRVWHRVTTHGLMWVVCVWYHVTACVV